MSGFVLHMHVVFVILLGGCTGMHIFFQQQMVNDEIFMHIEKCVAQFVMLRAFFFFGWRAQQGPVLRHMKPCS